jgi:GT2 family glycosyltransferase
MKTRFDPFATMFLCALTPEVGTVARAATKMDTTPDSMITVVISTRNRGASIVRTLQTILKSDYSSFEVRIVDQSEDELTESAIRPFLGDLRVHYTRTTQKGVSVGRNLAIRGSRSELIAATDDDCEIPADWLRELAAAFALDSRIGIVFGNVLSGPHDSKAGFVMAYVRQDTHLARSIREKHKVEGVAACMGIRKSIWGQLGGFDEMLGNGAPFGSAEETDLAIRALLAGYLVYETPRMAVVHHGFQSWEQSRSLFQGYLYGIGAMLVKNLKCGHWPIMQLFVHLGWRWAFHHPVVEFERLPPRGLRLAAFIRGLRDGALAPVNRATGHFVKPGNPIPVS